MVSFPVCTTLVEASQKRNWRNEQDYQLLVSCQLAMLIMQTTSQ